MAERFVSVFGLCFMSEAVDKIYKEEEVQELFDDRYTDNHKTFEKHSHEQVVTGPIEAKDDGCVLTECGKALMKL